MIRAITTLLVSLIPASTLASEIAIKCEGENTTFAASETGASSVNTELAPDHTFILDEEKKLFWRWLAPLNKRDLLCNDPSCIKVFTETSVDLFWQPRDATLEWKWGVRLDRVTGHGVSWHQYSHGRLMRHSRLDMMCTPTTVPIASKPIRAF